MKIKIYLFALAVITVASGLFSYSQLSRAQELNSEAILAARKQLEEKLKQTEAEIAELSVTQKQLEGQSSSLARDISLLDTKIKKSKLEIKARTIAIKQLEEGIYKKNVTIGNLDTKTQEQRESLAELLRQTSELDEINLFELMLGYDKMSDFFIDTDSIVALQDSVQKSIDEIKINIATTEKEKDSLVDKKTEELQLKTFQEMEKKKIEVAEAEKSKLLKATKGQEAQYKKLADAKKKDAASIRSQLFFLTGSPSIPFEKAVEFANFASSATGIRPAFLLGVITEESNLGKNVGTGSMEVDMAGPKCTKLREAFIRVTSELGLDPNKMPVSKKAWYGSCGGAMGPAQFMSTTWEGYKKRIAAVTGNNPPNPWNPQDAFVASALYLTDAGAKSGNKESERIAALKYLAGSNWNKSAYRFYGDDVMEFAAKYQDQINIIKGMSATGSKNSGG